MIIKQAQGYSKEKALETTGLDTNLERLKNATQAWKKSKSPLGGKELNQFFTEYIKAKKAVGAYVVVDAASDDTRSRPYNIINETTIGKRKTKTVYLIKEAELSVKNHPATKIVTDKETGEERTVEYLTPYVPKTITVTTKNKETGEEEQKQKEVGIPDVKVISTGLVVGKAEKKEKALKIMKELIEQNRRDYVIQIAKEVTEGQSFAGYGQYTPSKSAKVGTFLFCVSE